MSNPATPKLSLKVVMNKEKTKVLFAEANSDFVDVLLSFLTLPLGKVVANLQSNLGEEAPVIGSLNSLYTGLSNLNHTYFCTPGAKQMLLNPRSSWEAGCRKLVIDITDSPNNYFLCEDPECRYYETCVIISMYSDIAKCFCGKSLNREILVGEILDAGQVFTTDPLSFIITDDLCISPIVTGIIQTLSSLGYTGTQAVEMQRFSFGIDEIRDLLKFALTSASPLTDMIIKKTHMSSFTGKPEPGIPLCHVLKEKAHSRKIVLKVFLQKSTDKFLFAEATDEFVDLLCSFLTVPLGGVEFLFSGNTCFKNIDNLYRSVSNGIGDEYFCSPEIKNRLIDPKLPHGYISKNHFLPLGEEAPPKLYYQKKYGYCHAQYFYASKVGASYPFKLCKDLYVKNHIKCIATDDLTVCPGLATSLSILSGLEIPPSDVKEMELYIGLEEALSLLMASLSSKNAITDGLIKPILLNKLTKLERQPKNEL